MTEGPLSRVILPDGQVDWEAFHELVRDKDFLVYDPPQLLGRYQEMSKNGVEYLGFLCDSSFRTLRLQWLQPSYPSPVFWCDLTMPSGRSAAFSRAATLISSLPDRLMALVSPAVWLNPYDLASAIVMRYKMPLGLQRLATKRVTTASQDIPQPMATLGAAALLSRNTMAIKTFGFWSVTGPHPANVPKA